MKKLLLIAFIILFSTTSHVVADVYQTPEAFIQGVFKDIKPSKKAFWLKSDHKKVATDILGHKPNQLRYRYFGNDNTTVWILDEIGKEQPITVGIEISSDQIVQLKVLEYRESRGYEVRFPFFTDQFIGIALEKENKLNANIDGISGATMSVSALKRLARLALYLHRHTPYSNDQSVQKN